MSNKTALWIVAVVIVFDSTLAQIGWPAQLACGFIGGWAVGTLLAREYLGGRK